MDTKRSNGIYKCKENVQSAAQLSEETMIETKQYNIVMHASYFIPFQNDPEDKNVIFKQYYLDQGVAAVLGPETRALFCGSNYYLLF